MDASDGSVIEEITEAVNAHLELMEERAQDWLFLEYAYETRFWEQNPYTAAGKAPQVDVLFETNMIQPFVNSLIGALYFRKPRSKATPPALLVEQGRAPGPKDPSSIEALTDDWITRGYVREAVSLGFQMAIMFDSSALKLGIREEGDAITGIWLDVLPRWEVVMDERCRLATQQRYRGHLRYETVQRVEEITGESVSDIDGFRPVAMRPFLDKMSDTASVRRPNEPEVYLQLLEWYDLERKELRFFLVDGDKNAQIRQVGETLPLPWYRPDGQCAIPIIPVILANAADKPMKGLSVAKRPYAHNAETNLMLSVVASAMRMDSARMMAYLKGKVDEETLNALKSGKDNAWVPFKGETLENLWKQIEAPAFAESLPYYRQWIDQARKEAAGISDIAQGRQGEYLSATEAQLLVGADESTISETAARMHYAVARACELFLVMLQDRAGRGLRIQRGDEIVTITKELLDVSWTVEIQDSNATPTKDAAKKLELTQVAPLLEKWVAMAAEPVPPPPPPPGAQAAPPPPGLPGEVRAMASLLIDYAVTLYQLPDELKWSSLQRRAGMFAPKPPEPQKSQEPSISDAQAQELLALARQGMGAQGGQLPEGTIAASNPYKIEKDGDQFHVIKIDDGKVMGTFPSHAQAMAQFAALEIHAHQEE
ncbi:MAG TPA: hypothetical protein VI792_03305 [Candidatus Eisenbacteria bacterium]